MDRMGISPGNRLEIFGRKFLAMGSIGCGAALGRFSKSTTRQHFIRLTCVPDAL